MLLFKHLFARLQCKIQRIFLRWYGAIVAITVCTPGIIYLIEIHDNVAIPDVRFFYIQVPSTTICLTACRSILKWDKQIVLIQWRGDMLKVLIDI